jgi:hypothetical protein
MMEIADAESTLEHSIAAADARAHAAEWTCTMQLDALDEHMRSDMAALQNSVTEKLSAGITRSSRALHLLQKLMCRPDGAQLFAELALMATYLDDLGRSSI